MTSPIKKKPNPAAPFQLTLKLCAKKKKIATVVKKQLVLSIPIPIIHKFPDWKVSLMTNLPYVPIPIVGEKAREKAKSQVDKFIFKN